MTIFHPNDAQPRTAAAIAILLNTGGQLAALVDPWKDEHGKILRIEECAHLRELHARWTDAMSILIRTTRGAQEPPDALQDPAAP